MPSHKELDSDFVSIVVADSTRIHTQLLADALRNDRGLQVVAAASNSAELLAAVTRVPIDVVVISHDLDNQPGHGTEVLREMRSLRPQIKGVILLDSSQPREVLECFRAGARGIFSKQERLESLCKCIRSVHEGQIWARSVDLDHALEALANAPLVRATNHKGIELLSVRERQVIQHVAGGMSNREIAQALHLSPHTVKNYLFRIFDKLGVSSRTELLYLTMNNTPVQPHHIPNVENTLLSGMIEAAGAGDLSAQLRMAEHYCQVHSSQIESQNRSRNDGALLDGTEIESIENAEHQQDPVSAYAWYLLAQKTAASMVEQIEAGKKNVGLTMSPQQQVEAEARAAAWLRNTKKQAGFANSVETPGETHQKMHASAR
jgi:DNA-binding NarL/FixJ family response regulator